MKTKDNTWSAIHRLSGPGKLMLEQNMPAYMLANMPAYMLATEAMGQAILLGVCTDMTTRIDSPELI
jgi:hypothetical protein